MTTDLQTLIRTACAAAALAAIGALAAPQAEAATARREPNGAIRFYDDNGNDRGYAWCLQRGGRWFSGWQDCSFFSLAQCRAAAYAPGGYCEPNPWAAEVREPPAKRSRR
jgi:hypothetical protein